MLSAHGTGNPENRAEARQSASDSAFTPEVTALPQFCRLPIAMPQHLQFANGLRPKRRGLNG